MNIEVIDDILDELANKLYVYGSCQNSKSGDDCNETDPCCCRVGFMIEYKGRIEDAIANEKILGIRK